MLKNGVDYEEALTAIAEVYKMPKNTSWISVQFIDLQRQGRFNSILGKKAAKNLAVDIQLSKSDIDS